MKFLYFLEKIRTPALDWFFSAITYLGSETAFLVLAIVVYWCFDKMQGLYLLSVGGLGTIFSQFLKLACRIPRPWVQDPDFTIVEAARADATGYSFPSGHTQNAVGTFGCMALNTKKRFLRWLWIALAVLVPFSRMYLGVHTPWDVGAAALLAIVLIFFFRPIFRRTVKNQKLGLRILAALIAADLLFVIYANLWPFPSEMDTENLNHGVENSMKLLGALIGMTAGYWMDLRWVKFRTDAAPAGQIFKVVLGLALLLAVKSGLKPILGTGLAAGAVRYGIVTFFASGIWPMTFRYFSRLGKKG